MNLNIFRGKVHEEGLEGFGYATSVFDLLQQWEGDFPVVHTPTDVLLSVIVGFRSITLGY